MNDGRNPTLPSTIHAVHAAAQALKIEVKQYDVRKSEDFRAAFVTAQRDRVDAISMGTETITQANRKLIVELAGEYRIPVMYSSREFVDAGGLIVLGVNYQDLYRRSAIYVDKIFKGTKPGDLPIEQPTKFELVINLKTARALRITVPPTLLARADEVIEYACSGMSDSMTGTAWTKRSWWRRLSKTLLDSEASLFKSTVVGRAKSPERLRGQLGTRANTGRRGTFHIWRCAFPD